MKNEFELSELEEPSGFGIGTFLLGVAIGAIVTGGVVMLFAPRSGKETRELIKGKTSEAGHMAQERFGTIAEKARNLKHSMRS